MSETITINKIKIAPGEHAEVNLNDYRLPSRSIMEVPIHVYRSLEPGPVVLFMAGMHGDEINGIEIVRKLITTPDVKKPLCGTIIAVPILNIASFLKGSRDLPDGRDLNRCFPGTKTGSLGSRLAYDFMKQIVPQIDFGVDFHTGGAKINNYPQLRCVFDEPKNVELSNIFAAPFVLNSPYRDKTLRKEAVKKGKHILVYEAGESLRFNSLAINEGYEGCVRLLNHFKMTKIPVPKGKPVVLNSTSWVRTKISGLFRTDLKYGSFITEGQVIGRVVDPYGEMEEELISSNNGYIIGINNQPVVNEGDAIMHIGIE